MTPSSASSPPHPFRRSRLAVTNIKSCFSTLSKERSDPRRDSPWHHRRHTSMLISPTRAPRGYRLSSASEHSEERSAPRRNSPPPSSIPLPSLTSSAVRPCGHPLARSFFIVSLLQNIYIYFALNVENTTALLILPSHPPELFARCKARLFFCKVMSQLDKQPEQPQSSEKVVKALLLSTQYNCISITMDYKTSLTFKKHVLYCS